MILLFLSACAVPDPPPQSREVEPTLAPEQAEADWRLLVYMVGDNDLEDYVFHDLNELEAGRPDDRVRALVLADRAEGYDDRDGDWTGTRLYEISPDLDMNSVRSVPLEDWGEVDMADPETLARFLARADELMPADRTVLSLWDHGTGWYVDGQPPPGIGWDESSGRDLSIARGELQAGLAAHVAESGPIDIIAFDACNMAFFEVAHALSPYGKQMVAAQTTVGWEGLQYDALIAGLRADPTMPTSEVAGNMAADPVLLKGEWTFSATDLGAVADLAERLDRMAARGLSSPQAWERLMRARAETRGSEPGERYRLHYLDLADLGRAAELQGGDGLAEVGRGLADAVPSAVQAYGAEGFGWTSGLNLYAADWYLPLYSAGEGASWAEDTRWDEVLRRAEAQGR